MDRSKTVGLAFDGVGAKHSGAADVLNGVVGAALADARVSPVVLFCSPRHLRQFELPVHPKLRPVEVGWAELGPLSRLLWHNWGLPLALARSGVRGVLFLSGGGRAPRGIPGVTLIQQSLPFSSEALKRLSRAGQLRMHVIRYQMRTSCSRSALTIVQTSTMMATVAAALSIPRDRIAVVQPTPHVASRDEALAPALQHMRSHVPEMRLLYVGNTSSYKNLGVIPPAMREARISFPAATLFATVPHDHPVARAEGVGPLGRLPRPYLREAYELATALVMPSLTETVGLPLLEAASLGVPVIAADRPYARDVCGDTAMYFDPLDPASLAHAVGRLLGDTGLARRLGAAGQERAALRSLARPYPRMIDLLLQASCNGIGSW